MKALIVILLFLTSNIAKADWVVPSTGIVDYAPVQPQGALPQFDMPSSSTVNVPLPTWSQPVQEIQEIQGIQEIGGTYGQ